MPDKAPAKPAKARKVLIYSHCNGFRHGAAIDIAKVALPMLGKKTGAFEAVVSDDLTNFTPDKIKQFDAISEIPGLLPTTIVTLVLFFAWLAHALGAPELLGGFAAGLALSRRFFLPLGIALHTDESFAHRIEDQMKPIVHLFTPIFFVFVGLSLNLRAIDWGSPFIWRFSLTLLVAAIVGKFVGAFLIKEPWTARCVIAMAMIPRGEVGLIFAELGRITRIFNNEIYAGMVMVIALTTLLPPFIMKWFYGRYGDHL